MMAFKILYVEDEDQNRALIREVFKATDYDLIEAHDGQSGYDTALSERPDLILLDIGLPDIDGVEVFERIHQTPALNHIPVIALTADDSRENKERCAAAGFTNVLFKPISRFILLDTIRRHIESGGKPTRASHPKTGPLVSHKLVLIADDNEELGSILGRAFNSEYFDVRLVTNGVKAMNYLQHSRPAVVILDIHMPEISGFEVLSHIRSEDNLKETKVILITGSITAANDPRAKQADMVLLKPVDLNLLFSFAKQMIIQSPDASVQN